MIIPVDVLTTVPSRPAGRSGSFGAEEDELEATAVSNTDVPVRGAALGPADVSPVEVSQGFGRGGSDEVMGGAVVCVDSA
jgi:hypothetical protein